MTEMPHETTTITIDKKTMMELKKRAISKDMRYSEYLEELINAAWERENKERNSGKIKNVK